MKQKQEPAQDRKEILKLKAEICKGIFQKATPAKDLYGTVLNRINISFRIKQLARKFISYLKAEEIINPLFIITPDGSLPFALAFLKELSNQNVPYDYTTVQVSSYVGTKSGELNIRSGPKISPKGRNVYILEDLLDTGTTAAALIAKLDEDEAETVDVICLLDKLVPRLAEIQPLFACFIIGPLFVIGYGMDFEEVFRNLPDILVVDESSLPSEENLAKIQTLNKRNDKVWSTAKPSSALVFTPAPVPLPSHSPKEDYSNFTDPRL